MGANKLAARAYGRFAPRDAAARGRTLGIVDYITKPFREEELKEQVRKIVR